MPYRAGEKAVFATLGGYAECRDQGITEDGKDTDTGAGFYVIVTREENELRTLYMHLAKEGRSCNEIVEQGDKIGFQSNTGAGGTHLHFEIRTGPG
ncbi:MAG: M23 family metallopeptidase [Candidatus Pacebacteria bacterium]|nr:M23 family metallopeptidase [Candidatus Paceibacterota bacterium]